MNKKAAIGESIQMVYRLVIVLIIAVVIMGNSALVYDFYINTRNSEAKILTQSILDCIVKDSKIDIDGFSNSFNYKNKVLEYCGIKNLDRFYVKLSFFSGNNNILILEQGDSGKLWTKTILENQKGSILKYTPGYYKSNYVYTGIYNGQEARISIEVEVLINEETK